MNDFFRRYLLPGFVFESAVIAGGYATDPSYASKVAAIANSDGMRQALEALKQSVSAAIP